MTLFATNTNAAHSFTSHKPRAAWRRLSGACIAGLASAVLSAPALAQLATFSVTVNPGTLAASAPNSTTIFPGEDTSIRVTLSNTGAAALTNVNFNLPLPTGPNNGLTINGASIIDGNGPGCTGTLTTTPGGAGVQLSGMTVPANTDCYLDLPVEAFSLNGAAGSLTYEILEGEVGSDAGTNSGNGAQALTLRPSQRPTWSKAFNNITHIVGGASRVMTITVFNNDPNVPLTNIAFTDVFPTAGGAGATIEPTGAAAGGTCGGTVALTQGAAAQVAVSGVNLPVSSSCTITVPTQARHSNGVYNQNSTNSIPASGFTSDQGLRPSANANRTLRARSPLNVSKSFSPSIVTSGQPNTFSITLSNNGDTALPVTSFTDDPIGTPNSGLMNIAAVGDVVNSCAGGSEALESGGEGFTVSGFSIPAGGNCVITVTYTATTPGADLPTSFTNSIPQGAVVTSPGIISQARSATVLVADRLRVLKSRSPANAVAGDPVRYSITIENYDAAAINTLTVFDDLQNGSTFLTGGAFTPTLTPACGVLGLGGAVQGDPSVTFTIPTLPGRTGPNTPGQCVIAFSAMLDPNGTGNTSNVINAGDVCFNGGATCNGVGVGVVTNEINTMSLEKTFDSVNAVTNSEGSITRLRLELSNLSVSALTSLAISDSLPAAGAFQQLVVATPANISNDCGGAVTAVAGSTSVALNLGTVPAAVGGVAGTCALEIDVVGPAGVYPNTADASATRNNADGTTSNVLDSDGATLTYTDALQVDKFFNPATAGDNGTSTASVRFTSLDPSRPITGIDMTDNLPAGMVINTPSNAYSTCNGAPTLTADAGTSVVVLSGASLAPLAVCEVVFDVRVTGTTDWTNIIPAGGITADNGLTNRAPISATLTYVPEQDPLISKAINPGAIVPGQSATLTITVTNGAQDLTNLNLTDYFTADGTPGAALNGMAIAAAPAATTDCTDGIVAASPGGTSVSLSGASILAGTSCIVEVMITSTSVGAIVNTIPLDSITTDQGSTNSTTFAQSTLSTQSSVGVSKMFEPPVVSPTQPSRLTITILNGEVDALTGLALTDTFPAGLVVAPVPAAFSDCGGGALVTFPTPDSVMLDNGSIAGAAGAVAASCVIEVDVVAAVEGTYINTIAADSLTANGTVVPHPPTEATLQVRERIIVNKAFDDLTLDMGDPSGFTTGTAARLPGASAPLTIRLENPNNIALTQVNFIDELPAGLVLAAVPNIATTCTGGSVVGVAAGTEVRLTGATLGAVGSPDAICTVTADVVSNIPGIYTNEISAGDVTSFEGIDNDPLTQAQIIIIEPPAIGKTIDPPVIAPGAPATLTLIFSNDNDLATTLNSPFVDNLPSAPGQMEVAATPAITTTCPGGVGIVTAAPASPTVTIASGSAIPPGGCVVTVDVTATVAGDYLNFIPVGALDTTFGVNDAPAEAPLAVSTLGYISGTVFLDNQAIPDGTYIPGSSTEIAGNTIELRSGPDCTGPILDTTVTDAMGNYLFRDLPAGTYSVCQPTQPPGSLNSVTTQGSIAGSNGSTGTVGTASNPGTPTSQITGIVLNDDGAGGEVSGSPQNNFSEVLPASVAGNVWHDLNNDGIFDPGESGIGGVTVTLTGPAGVVVAVTNPDGSYSFTGLPPGDYTITETQPGAWLDGMDTLGTIGGVPVGDDSGNDVFTTITLAPGDAGVEYNFGEIVDVASLAINGTEFCANDAPQVNYEIPGFSGSSTTFTLEWRTVVGDRLVASLSGQGDTGTLLWPGVVLDGTGTGVDWPGWVFSGGEWSEVADDRLPELILRVILGGDSAETTIQYPRNAASCLTQPPGTFSTAVPTTPARVLWMLALMMILTGGWTLGRMRQA